MTNRKENITAYLATLPEKDRAVVRRLAVALWKDTRKGKRSALLNGEDLAMALRTTPRRALALARKHGPTLGERLGLVVEYRGSDYAPSRRGAFGRRGGGGLGQRYEATLSARVARA